MYLWPKSWIEAALREREQKAEQAAGKLTRLLVRPAEWLRRLLSVLFG